jgi:phage-related protein/gas vesicle protein
MSTPSGDPDLTGRLRLDLSGLISGLQRARTTTRRQIDGLVRDANGRLRDANGRFVSEVQRNTRTVGSLFSSLGTGIRQIATTIVSVGARMAGSFALAGAAIGGVLPIVAGLVAALSNIAPAAAVGVSAMLAIQLAAGTLKLAMVGVEDAISAALDPEGAEAYAEAIKKLSPEARKFTDVLREMAPELDEFRRQVQDRVFADFSTELTKTAKSVLPSLKQALLDTGDSLNAMAKGVAESARDLSDRGIFGKAVDSATTSLESMEQVPGRITTSLGLLAAASGPSLERIAKKADEVSARILESLTQSFESGELEGSIDGALELFEQMGRIVRNIFGGLKNIIGGVTTEAGSLFFILEELSGAFERLTASEEFQSILQQIVRTADELVQQVMPLLKEAFEQLAPVIEEIGPPLQDFIREVGPELQPLLKELGPILKDLAIIFREQLPFAIKVLKVALEILGIVLKGVHWVLETLIIPAVRKVAQVLNSDFVKALYSTSREASGKIGEVVRKFEWFRSSVATVLRTSAGRLWDFLVSVGSVTQGVARSMNDVIDIFYEMPGTIRSAVGDLGGILWDAGWRVIGGLIAGVRARIGELRSLLNSVTNMIPDWKGPAEKDARLLTPNGELLMEGLIAGIDATTGQLRARLADITRSLPGMLSIPGLTGGALSLAGPGLLPAAAPAAAAGGHTFNLYGADASPDGILRAMSWSALVGGTSG